VNDRNHYLHDIDPDLHLLNELPSHDTEYFLESSFNNSLTQYPGSNKSFSIFHANIRSSSRNFADFLSFLSLLDCTFSVIALSETWLNSRNHDLFPIPNYNHESAYREYRQGGGVSLYIHQSLPYKLRNDLSVFTDDLESIFLEITLPRSQSIIVGCIYRPPNTNLSAFNSSLNDSLHTIEREKKPCYLAGDFNVDLLKAETHVPSSNILELLYSHSYLPLINKPTRPTSSSLIDNIFSNNPLTHSHHSGIMQTDLSDHFPIFTINVSLNNCTRPNPSPVQRRLFSSGNISKFSHLVSLENWSSSFDENDMQASFSAFHSRFCELYESCFPLKTFTPYQSKLRWLTPALKKSIKIKNMLCSRSV